MANLTRRSVLRTSLALGAAGAFARPYIANAAATTATVWWTQGSAEQEDISFKKIVAEYEKASGNTIDYNIMPYAPLRQKIVSAVTSGVVPDVFQNNPAEIIALYAWQDKLVEVSDVVETQREEYTETALLTVRCYNNVEKKRGIYGEATFAGMGGKEEDAPIPVIRGTAREPRESTPEPSFSTSPAGWSGRPRSGLRTGSQVKHSARQPRYLPEIYILSAG